MRTQPDIASRRAARRHSVVPQFSATGLVAAAAAALGLMPSPASAITPSASSTTIVAAPATPSITLSSNLSSSATDTIERLRGDFGAVSSWLRGKARIGDDERRELDTFRRRVTAFREREPDNAAAVAMELQIATWLGDHDAIEAAYAKLAELRPGDPAIAMSRAEPMLRAHRYADALAIVEAIPNPTPAAAILKARALNGLNRFADALETLDAIPSDQMSQDAALKWAEARGLAEQCAPLWEVEQALRAAEAERDDLPRVAIETSRGTIVIELFEDHAPNTVANFIDLSGRNFYDGTRFHRVLPGFMAQGGDPNSRVGASGMPGGGGPGYRIADEHRGDVRRNHFTGSVAMAKTPAPDTGGSQFYISFIATPHLNGQHTVFGHVIDGKEIAMALKQDDEIVATRILRKRDRDYTVETLPEITFTPPTPPTRRPE